MNARKERHEREASHVGGLKRLKNTFNEEKVSERKKFVDLTELLFKARLYIVRIFFEFSHLGNL